MKKITFPVPSRLARLTFTLHPSVKYGYYRKAGYWKCLKQILSYNADKTYGRTGCCKDIKSKKK